MTVIKKSGKKEEFLITYSIHQICNQRTEETLDISALEANFKRIVEEKTLITAKQINVIIHSLLYFKGLL